MPQPPIHVQLRLSTPLITLAVLSAYLTTASLAISRSSPPWFFTTSLILVGTACRPSFVASILSLGVSIFGVIFFALDHIHGECGYDALRGHETWHKNRLGALEWYRVCIQASQAWWIMVVLAVLWFLIFIVESYDRFKNSRESGGIQLPSLDESD